MTVAVVVLLAVAAALGLILLARGERVRAPWGALVLAASPVAFHSSLPVAGSNATTPAPFPPTFTSSLPPASSGEHATPKYPLFAPYSASRLRCHSLFPVASSSACRW